MGPDEDLPTLIGRRDHLNILRYIRSHELREPKLVVEHGTALLGNHMSKSLSDKSVQLATLEQVCLAAVDDQNHDISALCLKEIRKSVAEDSARFRRLLARCIEASGELEDAMKMYEDLLQDNPSNVYALKRKYCVLRAQGDKDMAQIMEALNAVLEQNPSDTAGWNEMALLRLELGDYKGAAYALEEVVLGSPLDSPIHCRLAEVYATLGGLNNLKLARKHMAQSLELDESNKRALFGLVAVASAYVEEAAKASKREAEDTDPDVAKELVKYGGEQLIKSYKGSKLFAAVQTVVNEKLEQAENANNTPAFK